MNDLTSLVEPIIGVILHSTMLGVGISYTDGPDPDSDCKLHACYFLKVCGGSLLVLDLLAILVISILRMMGSLDFHCLGFIGGLCSGLKMIGQLVINIWGSVLILEPYQRWTYNQEDKISETFCEYTPYMFSFVMLILGWIAIPLACCAICVKMVSLCCDGISGWN